MRVTILFFGMLQDITGMNREQIDLAEPGSLGSIWTHYSDRFPRLAALRRHIRLALNQEFSDDSAPIAEGDEIAFLPPVSGGTDAEPQISVKMFEITREPIDTRQWVDRVKRQEDGAVVTFEGIVRDNTRGRPTEFLDYEGYEPMALGTMEALGREIAERFPIGQVAMVHRLGRIPVGEASVVIVVSAPHRKAAFEACFEAINRLKTSVPIWKKEHFVDGEVWVEGAWSSDAPSPA